MASKLDKDRFVPPIMHAFRAAFRERDAARDIDRKTEDGERLIAGRRASPRSAVSEGILRQELADDLAALLNTVNLAAAEDMTSFEHARNSILNYGIADLTAIATNSRDIDNLSKSMAATLERFEPRLIPGTIVVKQEDTGDDASGRVRLHINADMHSTPVDVAVEFVAEIEPDSGKMKVSRL